MPEVLEMVEEWYQKTKDDYHMIIDD